MHEAQKRRGDGFRYHARQCLMNSRRIALLADFSCRAFCLMTTVAALDGGKRPSPGATLLMGKGLDEQHPEPLAPGSAGASSKEVRQGHRGRR